MRNLKKSLCLVLALVFVLGLCTVGVGAANGTTFSDEKEIQYDAAVKSMSGLGILIGNDDNGDGVAEFSPKGTLTRAAAAKMIAYMVLGLDADKYPKIEVFSDVTPSDPATWWAAPYIAFCQSQGIIAGMGDGTFRPSAPVTQAQFAKMLLAACGYNGKKEFEGAGWDQNVAKVAMQTKILHNLSNVDWDGAATREEAALLTYNTMMKVDQVVLSKDTDDYKLKAVNGSTFASATWDLVTDEGYVLANKTNDSTANGIELNTAGNAVWIDTTYDHDVPAYFQADDAEDAGMLGHYVKITYRVEKIKGEDVAVAYFVEDSCKDVSGGAVLTAKTVATGTDGNPRTFVNGNIKTASYVAPSLFAPGVYVVNGDGKIVGYKEENYFLANITSISAAGAKFVEPAAMGGAEITVKAPEGAKVNDTYTVFKRGDVYTLEPCTKQEGVKIEQSKKDNGYWTYNNGKINGSSALNIKNDTYTAPVAGMTVADPDGAAAELTLGSTYTLYLDSKGNWYAYSDEATAASASYSYVYVLMTYKKANEFGTMKDYAQVIKADGTIVNDLPFTPNGDMAANQTFSKDGSGDGYAAVYKYSMNSSYEYVFTDATNVPAAETIQIDNITYNGEPTIDLSSATMIFWNGATGSRASASTTAVPAKPSRISIAYRTVSEGTTDVSKVSAVWFYTKEAKAEANSYIYVTSADASSVYYTKLVGSTEVNYYNAYKDGTKMEDLAFNPMGAPGVVKRGFANYTKDSSGYYSLTYVTDTADPNVIEQSVYLTADDVSRTGLILKGKLYVGGGTDPIDLSNVKIVRITNGDGGFDTDFSAWLGDNTKSMLTINSVATLESALQQGYGVRITFVEHINGTTHSVGTNVIYVVSVKK